MTEETYNKLKQEQQDEADEMREHFKGFGDLDSAEIEQRFKPAFVPSRLPYVMMEKGGDATLLEAVQKHQIATPELPIVLYQLLKAVQVMSEGEKMVNGKPAKRFVHHDLKPTNVMFARTHHRINGGQGEESQEDTAFLQLKLIDFGTLSDWDRYHNMPAHERKARRVVSNRLTSPPEWVLNEDFTAHPWSFDTYSAGMSMAVLVHYSLPSTLAPNKEPATAHDLITHVLSVLEEHPSALPGFGSGLREVLLQLTREDPMLRPRPSEVLRHSMFQEYVPAKYRGDHVYDTYKRAHG